MKRNETQRKQNRKARPSGPDSVRPQRPLRASHLIHEDLHLHQPRVGVPGRPVGDHPGKGDQGPGLTSELLREEEKKPS